MNILLTNDDGWGAPGLRALESVAGAFGNVWTVAPRDHMSGISHQMTFEVPMTLDEKSNQSFALSGTPADCVRVGLTQLDISFDWVLSGINKGANLGSDIFVSGTVAAAREASLFGCRAIAISQHLRNFGQPFEWHKAQTQLERHLGSLLDESIPSGCWLNLNFPDVAAAQIDSVSICRTECDRSPLPADFKRLESGELLYCSKYSDRDRIDGLDTERCFAGFATLTRHGQPITA